MNQIELARTIAERAHEGQYDKGCHPIFCMFRQWLKESLEIS